MGVNGFLHGNVIDGVVGTKLLPSKGTCLIEARQN